MCHKQKRELTPGRERAE
ncbi:unnamed protein product [Victoria cruziana]